MRENGSPQPRFDFDDDRTYFRVILPVHPRYQLLHALRESAHLWALGEKPQAIDHLERAFERQPSSGALASQIIEYAFAIEKLDLADRVLREFEVQSIKSEVSQPYLTMARLLIDRKRTREADEVLNRVPPSRTLGDTLEAAILKKRAKDLTGAHHLLAEAYSINPDDPQIVHEFAKTKLALSAMSWKRGNGDTSRRLNREAAELLRRAIQLTDDSDREAWCWFELAQALYWLGAPNSEVESAYLKAQSLLPKERRFKDSYEEWRRRRSRQRRKRVKR
jgi:ATP-dependent DNA helicase RecG